MVSAPDGLTGYIADRSIYCICWGNPRIKYLLWLHLLWLGGRNDLVLAYILVPWI